MNENDPFKKTVILTKSALHPYEDPSLHTSQPEPPTLNEREPFNDVVKHGDLIVDYQRNRTLEDYPRRLRPFVKFAALAGVVLLVGSLLWNVWTSIR